DADKMIIDPPMPSSTSKQLEIWFNRRVTLADGSFGGVVSVSLDPQYFVKFFGTIDIGRQGFISLMGLDGIVRARIGPGPDTRTGQDFSKAPTFAALLQRPDGSFNATGPTSATERIIGYRSLSDYPFVAAVGESHEEILADYSGERNLLMSIAAILSLIFLGAAGLLSHQVTVPHRVESPLRQRQPKHTQTHTQAERASRTKTEFLANMSHELRTPLNAIIGFSEIMIDGMMGPIGSPRYLEYAKDIHRSGTHLLDVISGILDMSKIET